MKMKLKKTAAWIGEGQKTEKLLCRPMSLRQPKKGSQTSPLSLVLLGDKRICPVKKWGRAFFHQSHPALISLVQASSMPLSGLF